MHVVINVKYCPQNSLIHGEQCLLNYIMCDEGWGYMISDFFCSFIFQNAIFLLADCYLVLVFTYCDRLRTVQDFRQIHTVLFCLFFFFCRREALYKWKAQSIIDHRAQVLTQRSIQSHHIDCCTIGSTCCI